MYVSERLLRDKFLLQREALRRGSMEAFREGIGEDTANERERIGRFRRQEHRRGK